MATATILGLDTAAGAYLARLLGARGYRVSGTGDAILLARLGVADDVVVGALESADEVYDLRGDAAATRDLLASSVPRRLLVATDPSDTALIADLAAVRGTGRFVATARVYPHESRLGPGTTPLARIVAAAAKGIDPDPADLASSTDCGWTAEYIDAMRRLLQASEPMDVAIATGHSIPGSDAARIAFAYFARAVPPLPTAVASRPGDPAPARAHLGWSAVTTGDDLVTVLCEGAAADLA